MKKIAVILGVFSITFFSCSKENSNDDYAQEPISEIEVSQEEPSDIVDGIVKSTNVNWTGFKTNDKIAVSGSFDGVRVVNTKDGTTPEEVLDGAKVIVSVASINSGLNERDGKLKMILFGAMENTSEIYGTINFRSGKTFIRFSMNNNSKEYEVKSTFINNKFTIETKVDLLDFNASTALEALNNACSDLHKGPDGVTKTWSEVDIVGEIEFTESFGK